MNLKRRLYLLVSLVVLISFAGLAQAENRAGAFSISPTFGGYIFENDQYLDNGIAYGLNLGYNFTKAFGAEIGLNFVESEEELGAQQDVDTYLYRLDGLYHFFTDKAFVPYVAIGAGALTMDPDQGSSETDFMANYGVGLKHSLSRHFDVRFDARHIYVFDDPDNNFLYTVGLNLLMGGEHPPVPVADADGDGVPDSSDRCPGTPQGVAVDGKGCPLDSDGDGVADYQDKCPKTPAGVAVDAKGCPKDSDGDGVADNLDKCPGTPAGVAVDQTGCPADSDGDGVTDNLDKCPDTAKGILVDKQGCPLTFTLQLEFDFNKADIRPEYHEDLKKAAEFIRNNPAPQILVAGHTDNQGKAAYNEELSLRRADAVAQYLIDNFGIDGSKMVPRGFGQTVPIADNATEEGRQMNRRVEITCCALIPEF